MATDAAPLVEDFDPLGVGVELGLEVDELHGQPLEKNRYRDAHLMIMVMLLEGISTDAFASPVMYLSVGLSVKREYE